MATLDRWLPSGLSLFVREWLEDPLAVGAVAPSGPRLAAAMTRDVCREQRIIELGPGTGAMTHAILKRGVEPGKLAVVELSASFAKRLQIEFPDVTVVCGDAAASHVRLKPFVGTTDAVISGLPLVLFGRDEKDALLRRSFEMLGDGGAFYQFTYGGRCPVGRSQLRSLGLRVRRVGITWLNLPPAFIYRITRSNT